MFKIAKPFFLFCETPLHCGSGNDLGVIDLPIQRERHTGYPKIESSSLKGALRETFEQDERKVKIGAKEVDVNDKNLINLSFGPDENPDYAGALGFTDARLLLFPVKSMQGVFAWITCPAVLERFKSDLALAECKFSFKMPSKKTVPTNSSLIINNNMVVLEEYTFNKIKKDDEDCCRLAEWLSENALPRIPEYTYWRDKIKQDIVILSDDEFRDFVTFSTEVITRIKINNETGTVQPGALFTKEYLPAESILYSLCLVSSLFTKGDKGVFMQEPDKYKAEDLLIDYFKKGLPEVFQLGGDATVGKGIVRVRSL